MNKETIKGKNRTTELDKKKKRENKIRTTPIKRKRGIAAG